MGSVECVCEEERGGGGWKWGLVKISYGKLFLYIQEED